ncbi:4Fe-4S binding protein [Planobispora takensis]|uniref:4Fe-4S binding protein n=1 Tax=Planobispora takensis TaxID=1367882 RepID=UPI0035EF3195
MLNRSVTQQYPEVRPDLPPRSRGVIALVEENCTVCMLCARECPDWCIYIDSHKETLPAPEGGRPRARNVLDRFAIDFSLCMYCGICIEVCPFDALFWSPEFEYAEGDIRNLVHEKDRLAAWVQTVPPPPAHEPNADPPKELTAASRPARPTPGSPRPESGPGASASGRTSGPGTPGAPARASSAPGRAPAPGRTSGADSPGTPAQPESGTVLSEASARPESGPGASASGPGTPGAPAQPESGTVLSEASARPESGPGTPGAPARTPSAPGQAASGERVRAGGEEEQPDGGATPPGQSSAPGSPEASARPEPGDGAPASGRGTPRASTSGQASDVAGTDPAEGSAHPPAGRTQASRPERPVRRASAGHASVRAIRPPGSLPKPGQPSGENDLSTGRSDPKKLSTDESGVSPAGGTPEQTSATDPDGEPEEES